LSFRRSIPGINMQVERWNFAQDGPLSEPALRRKLEGRGYRVSRYIDPPGTYFPMLPMRRTRSTRWSQDIFVSRWAQ
jgi:hypothetical protein